MTIGFEIGQRSALDEQLLRAASRYRYNAFVRKLGWRLSCPIRDEEQDQFDTDDTVYVIALDERDVIHGIARLLPTTRPYLLAEVFPYLVDGALPASRTTWELSRFAVTPGVHVGALRLSHMVFAAALDAAEQRGATRVVGVLSQTVERACIGFGARIERLGQPRLHGGEMIIAGAVDLLAPFRTPSKPMRAVANFAEKAL